MSIDTACSAEIVQPRSRRPGLHAPTPPSSSRSAVSAKPGEAKAQPARAWAPFVRRPARRGAVVEVTDGDNGWHVHIHALLCFGAQVSAELVAGSVGARMFSR